MKSEIQHLYLVRHGQTVLNVQDCLRGLADPPLDATGTDQALRLAKVLAGRGAVVVYSSPLVRATTTAEVIATHLDIEVRADPRFNDRDYGPWTGHPRAEVVGEFGSVDSAPGVEPSAAVLTRTRPALDAVLDNHHGGSLIVVSHDAVIGPLLVSIDPSMNPHVETGSWSELARKGRIWSVLSAGNVP